MLNRKIDLDLLIETSWEVCNKVGGIYTVLSTKARNLQTLYKDRIFFIGPDVWSENNPCPVFKESKTILKDWLSSDAVPTDIPVRVGRWDVPGKPIAILIKFDSMYARNNELFSFMWEKYGVDSLHAYGDYAEACAFSHAAGRVIESIIKFKGLDRGAKVIAHFNEWTTGMGLLYVKSHLPSVATLFTTHATSIGRSICGNGKNLYQYFNGYNGDQMAFELNMEAKHSLEKTAAHNADCFTTVSEITAAECEQLLDRKPDKVTPNGFEQNFVPPKTKFAVKRKEARASLLKVASALTGITFNDDEAFLVATSGRCEYRNKGLDLYIESMKKIGSNLTGRKIVSFILVPAWVRDARKDLSDNIENNATVRLVDPVITHTLNNPHEDAVLNHIHAANFRNQENDNVIMIYVPCYLNGNDGIFDKSYYDLLIGFDATVFGSYYEPWGYTPLESVAFGVPTVTTSLSGFGRWVMSTFDNDPMATGMEVVERNDVNFDRASDDIARTLTEIASLSSEQARKMSENAMKTAHKAAWTYFIEDYVEAFEVALNNATNRNNNK